MKRVMLLLQLFAKARGNVGFLGIAVSGTTFDLLEGKIDLTRGGTMATIDSTDADNNDATYGSFKSFISGDGELVFNYKGNYTGASAQELLKTTLQTGAALVACFGDDERITPAATTDYKTTSALVTSVTIDGAEGIQTITATIRINAAPTACAGTEILTAPTPGAAGKARGRTTGGAYLKLGGTVIANMLNLNFEMKREEIDATDADSGAWKTFIYGDYSQTMSGSLNYAITAEQELLKTSSLSGTALTMEYGFRTFSTGVAGKEKYAASGICTKFDVKNSQNSIRTADFTIQTAGVPTKTA